MVFSNLTIEYEREMLRKEPIPEALKEAITDFVGIRTLGLALGRGVRIKIRIPNLNIAYF